MTLDYRQTKAPYIGDGHIEFFYIGELYHNAGFLSGMSKCDMTSDYMKFMNHATFSQWVISEAAATCMANTFSASTIGHIHLNKVKLN